tara:strand:+ start:98 stop:316 length:219 start_codon:yes stop_codon:yes gene_type:complete
MTFEEAHNAISNKQQVITSHGFIGTVVGIDVELPGILAIPKEDLCCVVKDLNGLELNVRVTQIEYFDEESAE